MFWKMLSWTKTWKKGSSLISYSLMTRDNAVSFKGTGTGSLSSYVRVCVWCTCGGIHVLWHICGGQTVTVGVDLCWDILFRQVFLFASRPADPWTCRDFLVSISHFTIRALWVIVQICHCTQLHVVSGDSNTAPHTCVVSMLLWGSPWLSSIS